MRKYVVEMVLFGLGALFFILSLSISTAGFKGDVLNQRSYVLILCVLLMVGSLLSIVSQVVKGMMRPTSKNSDTVAPNVHEASSQTDLAELQEDQSHEIETADDAEQPETRKNNSRKIYASMALIVLFTYGFSYVGFFVTSFIFVFIITWMYSDWNRKEWLKYLLFSAALNVVLYFLFDLVNVYLPKAWLF